MVVNIAAHIGPDMWEFSISQRKVELYWSKIVILLKGYNKKIIGLDYYKYCQEKPGQQKRGMQSMKDDVAIKFSRIISQSKMLLVRVRGKRIEDSGS